MLDALDRPLLVSSIMFFYAGTTTPLAVYAGAGQRKRLPVSLRGIWENGFVESFNARLRDELLDGEIFYSLREAQILIESWRRHYNTVRPHGGLGYRPPAPVVFLPAFTAWPAALTPPAPPAKRSVEQRPTVH